MDLAKMINEFGVLIVIAVVFLIGVIQREKKLEPRLASMEKSVNEKNYIIDQLVALNNASSEALKEVAKSTDNVANSIKVINVTMEAHMELIRVLHEEQRENGLRLFQTDDKLVEIQRMICKMCDETCKGKE